MEVKTFILKLFMINIPSLLFIFNFMRKKNGSSNIRESAVDLEADSHETVMKDTICSRDDEPHNINDTVYTQTGNHVNITELIERSRYLNDCSETVMSDSGNQIEKCWDRVNDSKSNVVSNLYDSSEISTNPKSVDIQKTNGKENDKLDERETLNNISQTSVGKDSGDSLLLEVDKYNEETKDVEDGFLKFLKMCAGGRAKLLDQDDEVYGFDEDSETVSNRKHRKKRPPFRRSSGVCLSPTPMSIHCKETSSPHFDFRTKPKQAENEIRTSNYRVPSAPKEISAQQESGIYNELVDDDHYNFSYPQRGYMILIVNDRFLRQSAREGANWDLQKTKQIAAKLGFRICNSNMCRNLTKQETISILRQAQNLDHSSSDCFMFVISSHGLEMPNPRAKGKLDHAIVCSDDQLIFTSNILEMFNEKNCPTLKNKPKMFFVQACRGEKYDKGSEVPVVKSKNEDKTDKAGPVKDRFGREKQRSIDVTDTKPYADSWATNHRTSATAQLSPPVRYQTGDSTVPLADNQHIENGDQNLDYSQNYVAKARSPGAHGQQTTAQNQRFHPTSPLQREHLPIAERPYPINESPSLQCDTDFLVMYAIPPGYFAWRNTADGSWMIDYLHKTIMSYNMKYPQDFLKLLRKVSQRMCRRQTNTPSDMRMHEMKAIPVIEHKLVKDIVFKPKAVMSSWLRRDTTFLV